MNKFKWIFWLFTLTFLTLTGCNTFSLQNNVTSYSNPALVDSSDTHFWQNNKEVLWNSLIHLSSRELQKMQGNTQDPVNKAWIQLALVSKTASTNTPLLLTQLMAWRQHYPSHPANTLFPDTTELTRLQSLPKPHHIALLLPLQGSLAKQGQALRDGFLNAYYTTLSRTGVEQTISFYDTSKNPNTAALYQEALAKGADTVLGPLTKQEVDALLSQSTFPVQTIGLNYTEIRFGSLPSHFYEYGLSPLDEATQMAEKAQSAGLHNALIIAPQNEWGKRTSTQLTARWKSLGGKIIDTFYFSPKTNMTEAIANLLHIDPLADRTKTRENNNKLSLEQQRRQDFDVIFLLASPGSAQTIVPLLRFYYADNIPIYATSNINTGSNSLEKNNDLEGVNFSDIPWVLSNHKALLSERLFAVGMDAYLLNNELPRLLSIPQFPLYGATGALTVNNKQQVYRHLPWVKMHAGHPEHQH